MTDSQRAEREVPWQPAQRANWQLSPVKHHFDILLGKMLQPEKRSPEDVEVPYLKAQHIQWDKVLTEDLPTMWATPGEVSSLQVRKGDLLVCEGGEVGRAAIVTEEPPKNCIIQNALHLVRPKQSGDVRFLRYLLQQATSNEWLNVLCNRATIAHFTVEKFSGLWIWVPPLPEQHAIADYLDQETSTIDALITEKERLLSLLAEKRRALITQAVTRGLNPNVPMRNSGVEWLGEIPRHWETPPVYARYEVTLGKMLDEKRISGTYLAPYLRNVDVQWHKINTRNLPEMDFDDTDRQTYVLKKGDLLICEGGEVGRAAIWEEELNECYYQKALHRLRPLTSLDNPKFFAFLMEAVVRLGIFAAEGNQSTIQHLTAEKLRVFRFPSPPYAEQSRIVANILSKTAKINSLHLATGQTIMFLHERRTALISAAVTGQIYVRTEP